MHRCLAIILLVLLPLQFSWAAVALYCGHESDSQAGHVGHHEHEHKHAHQQGDAGTAEAVSAQPVHSIDKADTATVSVDLDCSQCHGCCAALPLPANAMPLLIDASRPVSPVVAVARTLASSPPERPQWPASA